MRIRFRGLPGNIKPNNELWCVSGLHADGTGGGVLEWCYDRQDANQQLARLRETWQFKHLRAHKWDRSEQNWKHVSWTKEGGCTWDKYRNYVHDKAFAILSKQKWFTFSMDISHEHTRGMYQANSPVKDAIKWAVEATWAYYNIALKETQVSELYNTGVSHQQPYATLVVRRKHARPDLYVGDDSRLHFFGGE